MKKYMLGLAVACFVSSCQSGEEKQLPSSLRDGYSAATRAIDECQDLLADYQMNQTQENFIKINQKISELSFDYDGVELDEKQYKICRATKVSVDSMKREMKSVIANDLILYDKTILSGADQLIEKGLSCPFYVERDEDLQIKMRADNRFTLKIYNADSRKQILVRKNVTEVDEPLHIFNSAIYLLEVTAPSAIYADYTVSSKIKRVEDLMEHDTVTVDTIPAHRGDFRVQSVDGVKLRNLFEEPRKITLRSQGKAIFSGSTRSVVALNLPANSADIMYNLRISTSDSDRGDDGEFFERTDQHYRKVRFLGLPLYESNGTESSLLRELLSVSHPDREEEAYCSMYVFKSAADARQFQNNIATSKLKYNMDYSIVGTQSCNGRIPVKGMKTLYLGFENQKMTSSVYLWLEAVSAVRTTEYFKEKYNHKK